MKAAIVVGHNLRQPGAFAPSPIGECECTFNGKIADRMIEMAAASPLELKKFERRYVGSFEREIQQTYGQVEDWGANVSVELHFNADSALATGTETLSSGSRMSRLLGTAMQQAMVEALGVHDRGLKFPGRTESGWWNLHAASPPAVLVEPFFSTNRQDLERAVEVGIEGLARVYLDGLHRFFDLDEVVIEPPPDRGAEDAFLIQVDLITRNLGKPEFFALNKQALTAIVDRVNQALRHDNHGEAVAELSMLEAICLMNAEMGLKNGKVDDNHTHSNGERGLLPLPASISYWNGPGSPSSTSLVSAERNAKEFLMYLGNLKNRDIGREFSNGALYRDLFSMEAYEGKPRSQMALLAAAVHGWFYPGSYENSCPIPYRVLADIVAGPNAEPEIIVATLQELGYRHAQTENGRTLLRNRLRNLEDGIEIARNLNLA
jgi:N-acetylmuramoyl-L-alanine amidase